jgi:transposase
VLPGNTSDKTTLSGFLHKIEAQYGKARRIWVMDRGIPTEAALQEMRQADPVISYLVGAPKGRLTKLEKALLDRPWPVVRDGVDVKLLPRDGELYGLARSHDRINKERAMRRRQRKALVKRLKQLQQMTFERAQPLLLKLGEAKGRYRPAWRLLDCVMPKDAATPGVTFSFRLNRHKLRQARRREGRYLLRTNLCEYDPAQLWRLYIQLVEVEAAFKDLKGDLQLRPIYHQLEHRIEAHIFVAFIAYCLHVTLKARLRPLAPGLTPRAVLDKLAAIQMLDVHLPTTDGRTLILTRYTEPNPDHKLIIQQLNLTLPPQPLPRITVAGPHAPHPSLV